MSELKCVVCGKPADGVVASMVCRGMSNAKCYDCNSKGLEPWNVVVGTTWVMGGLDGYIPEIRDQVVASMKFHGKTEDDLKEAIKKMDEEYDEFTRCNSCGNSQCFCDPCAFCRGTEVEHAQECPTNMEGAQFCAWQLENNFRTKEECFCGDCPK